MTQLSLLDWLDPELSKLIEEERAQTKELVEKSKKFIESVNNFTEEMGFQMISCHSCGDTILRGSYEVGCPECGADENKIVIQG